MVDLRIGSTPFFDRGIESIIRTPESPRLPDRGDLAPSELAGPAALDELLFAANLESLLDAYVRPTLAERDLLTPQRFRDAMESVVLYFVGAADTRRRANPRVGKTLDGAVQLLTDDIELRDLLQMYRYALLQG
jgi:type III secretion protein X